VLSLETITTEVI
jgi:nicotinamide-nucleotide amidase